MRFPSFPLKNEIERERKEEIENIIQASRVLRCMQPTDSKTKSQVHFVLLKG